MLSTEVGSIEIFGAGLDRGLWFIRVEIVHFEVSWRSPVFGRGAA